MSRATAILRLLDDDDPEVTATLSSQLREDPALLGDVWDRACVDGDPSPELTAIALGADADRLIRAYREAELEAGTWLLCQLRRPRHDHARDGGDLLDRMAETFPAGATAGEIARILGQDLGFHGDRTDYHHPDNSFLDRVLERRCGLPLTLTALWMLLCRRRGLEAEALTLPGHVVGCWSGGYLDLFEGGRPVDVNDIDRMCLAGGFVDPARFLVPVDDRTLLQRMARNLVYAYAKLGDDQRSAIAAAMAR